MANTAQDFESVFTTYRDIKEANPKWSDLMVEDYLSLKRNVTFVSEVGDASIEQIEINRLDIELLGFEIDALDVRVTQNESDIVAIKLRLDALEALIPVSVLTAVDYQSLSNEVITCTNVTPITVTMIATPVDQQSISIKRTSDTVTIEGNGKLIDGAANVIMNRQYVGLDLVYSAAGGFWSIV